MQFLQALFANYLSNEDFVVQMNLSNREFKLLAVPSAAEFKLLVDWTGFLQAFSQPTQRATPTHVYEDCSFPGSQHRCRNDAFAHFPGGSEGDGASFSLRTGGLDIIVIACSPKQAM